MGPFTLASLGVVLALGLYGTVRHRRQRALDAAWEARHPRSAFEYCGRTVHFYEGGHGNQIEFLDPGGRCYLWYPGNPVILVGDWRSDGRLIYFRYGNNTYNPITGITGGRWEPCPIDSWTASIAEHLPGDILELKRGLPFVLAAHPAVLSLKDLAATRRQ